MHVQSKLHHNSILTGSVDSYCLVCDNYLRSEDEAFTHTEKPIHKKNMLAATRVEKFIGDRIIKVKKGYYCPFCNMLLSTTPKVVIHIDDTSHHDNKGAQMLSRIGNNVIAFDEFAITLDSWNGLMENTCVICNTEFDQNDLHKTDQIHVLRLVQSKCEFGDKYVYRKVDEESFFCLICGSLFSIHEKLNHHENNSHKNFYEAGIRLKNKISSEISQNKSECLNGTVANEKSEKEAHEKTEIKKQSDVLDRVDEFQKAGININFTRERARCMRCGVDLPFDSFAIQDHIEKQHNIKPNPEFNKQGKKLDTNELKIDTKKFENGVKPKKTKETENEMEPKPDAKKIDDKMEATPDTKTHNKRLQPKSHSKKQKKSKNLGIQEDKTLNQNGVLGNNIQISDFIKTIIRLDTNLRSDMVLNNKYMLHLHSFHVIKPEEPEGYRCMLCNIDFTEAGEQLTRHMNEPDHTNKVFTCPVVRLFPEEFIREINLHVFHCGYCNVICNDWIEMQDHLSHLTHLCARRQARWNLERCHFQIRNAILEQISSMPAIN